MNQAATTKPKRPRTYDSAIDLWIAVLLMTGPVVATAAGVALYLDGRAGDASMLFLIAGVTLIVTVALTLPCRYTILDDALSIRCGLVFYQIPLSDIESVQRSASLRSGPALSARRIAVSTRHRDHLLSPKDREAFIDELRSAIDRSGQLDTDPPTNPNN